MKWLQWESGRQNNSYKKMLLAGSKWPIGFDCYLLKFEDGASIPPHTDPVTNKKHYRVNVILKSPKYGGHFYCNNAIYNSKRIKIFRSDISEHGVTRVSGGSRYVLSIGVAI